MSEMQALDKIQKIDINSSEYPYRLKNIPDPPEQLYCLGDISLLDTAPVAVVGSRKYTVYGKNVAKMIGRRLGECGITVVSGFAYGIDAFAHEGALDGGGRVIGVIASGIRKMGPKGNLPLMKRAVDNGGLIVTEYEPDMNAQPFMYPRRNRIISGISDSVVVVEANFNSGALITAQHANEQGRPVYAVPGNINSQFSAGSNLLIRDGAYPLVVIDDIIRDLGIDPKEAAEEDTKLGKDEMEILREVRKCDGISPNRLAEATGRTVALVNSVVTIMEIKGVVETCGGKIYLAK